MKANPWLLIRAHHATLVDARNGRVRLRDHAVFEGLPLAVVAAGCILGISLPKGISAGLLTVAGLMSVFLFGAMLQIAERAMDWANHGPAVGPDTSRQAKFLDEIAANAGYASLISILTAAMLVAASVARHTALVVTSAVGLGLAVHLVLVLLMVMVRVFALIQEQLLNTRTGATVTPLPERKAG